MSTRDILRKVAQATPGIGRHYETIARLDRERQEALSMHERVQETTQALKAKLEALKEELKQGEEVRVGLETTCAALSNELESQQTRWGDLIANVPHRADMESWFELVLGGMNRLSNDLSQKRKLDDAVALALRRAGERTGGSSVANDVGGGAGTALYLDLLEASLTGTLRDDPSIDPWTEGYDPQKRAVGRDWPATAETMIGTARMANIRSVLTKLIADGVPGDLIETGVWRGGACIYMRGILAAHGETDRTVWVADSFKGLPQPDEETYEADKDDAHSTYEQLAVSQADVAANFERYGLLDGQVKFLEGWFKDTLPDAPIEKLALLRLDGDMYESTIQALDALYHKVSPGGAIIVDDYVLPPCAQAINDFRDRHGITAPMEEVDGAAVYWFKAADEQIVVPGDAQDAAATQ